MQPQKSQQQPYTNTTMDNRQQTYTGGNNQQPVDMTMEEYKKQNPN